MGHIIFKDPRPKIAFKEWLKAPNVFEKETRIWSRGQVPKVKNGKRAKSFCKKRGFGPGLGQVSLCQVISLIKEKIGKNTRLLFEKQGKNNKKKRGFCPGVRLGESMLGN